jgi:fatty acid desaturase
MGHLQNWVEESATDIKRLATAAKRLYVLAYLLLFLAFLQFLFAVSRRDDAMVMMFVALWFVMATTNFVLAELYRERYQRLAMEHAAPRPAPTTNDARPTSGATTPPGDAAGTTGRLA